MTARVVALAIGAVLVLGLGLYLLIAVRAQPAESSGGTSELPPGPERAAAAEPVTTPADTDEAPGPPAPSAGEAPSWVPSRPTTRAVNQAAAAVAGGEPLTGPKLDAVMAEANKAYDRGEYDDAKQIATRVLAQQPDNVRMLRILVSAACIDGDSAAAEASFVKLPPADQAQMRTRCLRYGIMFAGHKLE